METSSSCSFGYSYFNFHLRLSVFYCFGSVFFYSHSHASIRCELKVEILVDFIENHALQLLIYLFLLRSRAFFFHGHALAILILGFCGLVLHIAMSTSHSNGVQSNVVLPCLFNIVPALHDKYGDI